MKKAILLILAVLMFTFSVSPALAESKKEIRIDAKVDSVIDTISVVSNTVVDNGEVLVPITVIDQLNQEAGSIKVLYASHPFEDSITILGGKNKPKAMMFFNQTSIIWIDVNKKAYYRQVSVAPRMIDNVLYIPLDVLELLEIKVKYDIGKSVDKPVSKVFTIRSMNLDNWIMVVENNGSTYQIDFSNRALGAYGDYDKITLKYAKSIEGQSVVTDGMPNVNNEESMEIYILEALKQKRMNNAMKN